MCPNRVTYREMPTDLDPDENQTLRETVPFPTPEGTVPASTPE
jgi:hypothetical protein